MHLLDVFLVDGVHHILFLDYQTAVSCAQFHHFLPSELDVSFQVGLAAEVVKHWGAFPREGTTVLAEVALTV